MLRDIDGEGLCKDVGLIVFDFPVHESHFVKTTHLPGAALSPSWASMALSWFCFLSSGAITAPVCVPGPVPSLNYKINVNVLMK